MNKKNFTKIVLNKSVKAFIIYITFLLDLILRYLIKSLNNFINY